MTWSVSHQPLSLSREFFSWYPSWLGQSGSPDQLSLFNSALLHIEAWIWSYHSVSWAAKLLTEATINFKVKQKTKWGIPVKGGWVQIKLYASQREWEQIKISHVPTDNLSSLHVFTEMAIIAGLTNTCRIWLRYSDNIRCWPAETVDNLWRLSHF